MKIESRSLATLALTALLGCLAACDQSNPCGDGFYEGKDYQCYEIPAPAVADGGVAETSFGKTCTAQSDCSGDAPVCAAPQLPYCTQVSCAAGEANEGKCPTGFTCVTSAGSPSACVKM